MGKISFSHNPRIYGQHRRLLLKCQSESSSRRGTDEPSEGKGSLRREIVLKVKTQKGKREAQGPNRGLRRFRFLHFLQKGGGSHGRDALRSSERARDSLHDSRKECRVLAQTRSPPRVSPAHGPLSRKPLGVSGARRDPCHRPFCGRVAETRGKARRPRLLRPVRQLYEREEGYILRRASDDSHRTG